MIFVPKNQLGIQYMKTNMSTLSNVNTRRGGNTPPNAGFTPNVFPKAQSSQTGVSVKYAQDPNKQWFVLRATYNRENKAYQFITKDHTEVFLPTHYVQRLINGKRKRVIEPLLPQLIFVYSTRDKVETYVKNTSELSFLNYYYNHFKTEDNGNNPPLTISYNEMMNFINVVNVDDDHIMLVEPQQCHYKSGDNVQIVQGKFTGVKGRVARVSGQQRIVVEIEGLCLVATAYIPSAFIKSI